MPENSPSLKQSIITNAEMLKFAGMSVFIGSVLLGTARRAYAATLNVTNTSDTGVSGDGSLRGEILAAAPGDTIQFASGVTGTIVLGGTEIATKTNLTITGPGSSKLTISGNNTSRIFDFNGNNTNTVSISGLTLTKGNSGGSKGGAIYCAENLNLTDVTISQSACTSKGGGIELYGSSGNLTVTISNCTITGNTATGRGGGGHLYKVNSTITNTIVSGNTSGSRGGGLDLYKGSTVLDGCTISGNITTGFGGGGMFLYKLTTSTVKNCTISGNKALTGRGGGVFLYNGVADVLQNCTISGNTASSSGGGVYVHQNGGVEVATIQNSTISGNSGTGAGGIYRQSGTVNLSSTIVAGNTVGGVANDINAGGVNGTADHNLVGTGTGVAAGNGNLLGSPATPLDPMLNPLANNGGPTQTQSLKSGSPAIDAGTANGLTLDQRGTGFPRVLGASADIGAFERDPIAPTATLTSAPNATPQATTYTFTITFADNIGLDVTSLGNNNILVTGPGGFSQKATFVSANPNADAASIVATYSLTSATAFAPGIYTVAVQSSQVNDLSGNPVAAGSLGTFAVASPGFTSPPTITFTNPTINVPIQFSAAGVGTIVWDFGDGTTATGPNVTHVYTVPGTYIVTATLIDPSGLTTTQTVSLTINPSPILIKHARFILTGKDSALLSGFIPLTSNANFAGLKAVVTIAGASQTFTLDAHGKGKQGSSSFSIRTTSKLKVGLRYAPFAARISGIPLAASFKTNAPVDAKGIAQVPVLVQIGNTLYTGGTLRTRFTNNVGKFPTK